jgi:prolyl-tRNA synthetase
MRFSRLFTYTTKEDPKDASLPSHKYLVKAGFIKQISAGIYDFLPLGKMVFDNIRNIVKEEMDKAGAKAAEALNGQEFAGRKLRVNAAKNRAS